MSDSQDAFVEKANETLEEKTLRICEKIISSGLAIRGGQIIAGARIDEVKNAINSMSRNEIDAIYNSRSIVPEIMGSNLGFASMIALFGGYLKFPEKGELLNATVRSATELKILGWQTDAQPATYDLDYPRIKRECYVEPEGLAKKFVEAFDIGYKSPSTPKPKTPTGA